MVVHVYNPSTWEFEENGSRGGLEEFAAGHQGPTPVILAIQEAEVRRIMVQLKASLGK
jgi:hypothetical protein